MNGQKTSRLPATCFVAAVLSMLAVLTFLMSGCSRQMTEVEIRDVITRNCRHDVDRFILEKLQQNKVVMLADFGHGVSLYQQGVISFLNFWLDTLERSRAGETQAPTKVLLVIEDDSIAESRIRRFFASGDDRDIMDVYRLTSPQYGWETLEYYNDLRSFWRRAEAYNVDPSNSRKIQFDILCPEKVIDVNDWSIQKRDEFFVHERDEYSSSRIIRQLDNSNDTKALIFYGASHLNKEKALKRADKVQDYGYYLAYYLARHYQDNGGVYIIDQAPLSFYRRLLSGFSGPGSTYAIDNSVLKGSKLLQSLHLEGQDGSVVFFEEPIPPTSVSQVWSMKLAKFFVTSLDTLADTGNEFNMMSMGAVLRYLNTISGIPLKRVNLKDGSVVRQTIAQWKNWIDTTHLDVVADIDSLALWKRLVDLMPSSLKPITTWYESMIADAGGFEAYHDTSLTAGQRADDYWDYVQKNRRQIVLNSLVALLWVGTPEEQQKAMAILTRETGQQYTTPKQWAIWWRSNRVALPEM